MGILTDDKNRTSSFRFVYVMAQITIVTLLGVWAAVFVHTSLQENPNYSDLIIILGLLTGVLAGNQELKNRAKKQENNECK
jgi:hypothetical protein